MSRNAQSSPHRRWMALAAFGLFLFGCGDLSSLAPPPPASSQPGSTPSAGNPVDSYVDEETTAEERAYMEVAHPFYAAIIAGDAAAAYAFLSSHARGEIRLVQFIDAESAPDLVQGQPTTISQPTAEQFGQWLELVRASYGMPHTLNHLYVETTDAETLSGPAAMQAKYGASGNTDDQLLVFDAAMAVGGMPDSIPAAQRRASLRGEVACRLEGRALERLRAQDPELASEIEAQNAAAPDEYSDEGPYFKLLVVLVEDAGQTRVGYFEFQPPSILD